LVSLDAPDPDSGSPPPAAAPPAAAAAPPPAPVAAAAPPPLTSPTVRNVPEPETPRAPPPPPSLAGAQPVPQSAPSRAAAPPRYAALPPVASAPPQGSVLGQVSFAPNSAKLNPTNLQAVEAAALAQRQSGQPVRIVGHGGGSGDSPAQQLAGFRIALDRATAVAGALRQAGVPTDQILLETAPADGNASNQAEIFLGN
jgi:outer membrane protein OmpA-like peptidoglycan-associated protein